MIILESSGDSLCLPSGNKEFCFDGPDEKPGYDAFEPMISDTSLLKSLSECVIERIGGKTYTQLGVTGEKDDASLNLQADYEDVREEEKEEEELLSNKDTEDRSHLKKNEEYQSVEKIALNDHNFTEYLPLGISYLEMIQNDQASESMINIDFKIFKKTTTDQIPPAQSLLNVWQNAQNCVEINQEEQEEQQKKEIEDLTKELMLTSELIVKPIDAPCFGTPNILLHEPKKPSSNLKQLMQSQLEGMTKKVGRPRRNKTGQKYDRKKSTGDETSLTRENDKLFLIKDDLIEEEKIGIASINPEKNNATSSNNNKTSSLNELYAELVDLKNQFAGSTTEKVITTHHSSTVDKEKESKNNIKGKEESENEEEVEVEEEEEDLDKTLDVFASTCLPDAFDLWKEKYRSLVIEEYPEASRREVENRLMEIWCKLPANHQKRYFEKADKLAKRYNTSASLSYMKRYKNAPKRVSSNSKVSSHKVHQPKAVHVIPSTPPSTLTSSHAVYGEDFNRNISNPQLQQSVEANLLDSSTTNASIGNNGDIEDATLFDDFILSDCFDYKKAVKETATYNSPMSKELKKKLNKSFKEDNNNMVSYQDASSINLDDEHSFSTGIFVDIMIASANNKEEMEGFMDDLSQLKPPSWSPLGDLGDLVGGDGCDTTGDLTTLDVSALDDFLTGADVSGIVDRSLFLDEPALTSSPKPVKPKRKTYARRRTKKADGTPTKPRRARTSRKTKVVETNKDDSIIKDDETTTTTIDINAINDTTVNHYVEEEKIEFQPEGLQDLL